MSKRRKFAVIALVYIVEGYPMGVFRDVWPVYFRDHGVSLATIGAVSGLYLAWSLKVFWSPLVDRFGERRVWIAGSNGVMALALALMAASGTELNPLLWCLLAGFCVASATQDVAIDAYTIGIIDRGEEGPANSVRITAYRVALVAAGGGLLLLPSRIGWSSTYAVAAGLNLAMAASVLRIPRVEVPQKSRREMAAALGRWLAQPGALPVFAFVLLYRLGDIGMAPMLKPFWVDRGLSHDQIALVSTTFGAIATVGGAILGGWIVSRIGIGRALLVLGALALASNLGYAAAARYPESGDIGIYTASLVESFCGGLASAGFLAYLMNICDKQHAAVEYAVLTALYALPGTVAGFASGVAVEQVGYAGYFSFTAVLALPAFAFLGRARAWIRSSESGP